MYLFSHYAETLRTLNRTLQTKREGHLLLPITYKYINSNANKSNKQQTCDDMGE